MNEDPIAIFPLPNVIFFPKTILPLHIFEPRYCEMVRDTIATKQLIGMFLLQPGWQEDYYGNPPIFSTGCAGEMIHVESLPEGKYDIVLQGLYKVRAMEMVQEFPYRKARVEILPDTMSAGQSNLNKLTFELTKSYARYLSLVQPPEEAKTPQIPEDFTELVNTIATILPLEVERKFELLSMNNIMERGQDVLELLNKQVSVLSWTNRYSHLRPEDPNRN